jgi:OOP family OmpA-OmpF porin
MMTLVQFRGLAVGAMLALSLAAPAHAQTVGRTIGYAEAIDAFSASCGNDIRKHCKGIALGGGRVQQCLAQKPSLVSARCQAAATELGAWLRNRAAARQAVLRVCDIDIRRLCAGVQAGDGNLLECFYKAKRNVSPRCQQTIADAGYEVSLGSSPKPGAVQLSATDLVNSLQGAEAAAPAVNAASLRQRAAASIRDPSRADRTNRAPLFDQLGKLAQFTIAVQFDFDSAIIRPDSFRAVGLMADALYHPYLQGYRFLIVGHTDAKGSREYNLRLSERRANAIRDALMNPFDIQPGRLEAVGLGEEQLLNRANPEAAENRRVQLINIGR